MNNLTIIIPMAGDGIRFKQAGFIPVKPLITVFGKTMVERVVDNLNIEGNFIFIIREDHDINGELTNVLLHIKPTCKIIKVNKLTEGPACTALLAKQYITEGPLLIINCDQIIEDFDITKLLRFVKNTNADGVIGAFVSSSDKNSYMKLDPNGHVTELKEKIVISNLATNGLHFWKNGKYFIESTKTMIKHDERYNKEFYIAPTFNYMIKDGLRVLPFFYNLHYPIGTPEDLIKYLELNGHH